MTHLIYDLHSHSSASDGEFSPSGVVALAKEANIDVFALTDHDTIAGVAEAQQASHEHGIQLITGVEISTTHQLSSNKPNSNKSMGVHVVGLNFELTDNFCNALERVQDERKQRAITICDKLQTRFEATGYTGNIYALCLELALGKPEAITRSHIAKVLVQEKLIDRYKQVFSKLLGEGKPAYVPMQSLYMHDAIRLIQQAGGIAVLAHPTKYGLSAMNTRKLIGDFARLGGDAVELAPKSEQPATRGLVDRCAEIHNLMVSVGSDFHGSHMPWLKLADVPTPKPEQTPVWTKFK